MGQSKKSGHFGVVRAANTKKTQMRYIQPTIKNYQYVRLMSDKYCEIKEANCRQECLVFVTDLRKNNGNKSRGSYDHATCL